MNIERHEGSRKIMGRSGYFSTIQAKVVATHRDRFIEQAS